MLHIALYQPEIPPNTGNIIRLCANTNIQLHLIHPLGFSLDNKHMKRAGLDYHEFANVIEHDNYDEFLTHCSRNQLRVIACETSGQYYYHQVDYQTNDCILMGPETRGLPETILAQMPTEQVVRIPMRANSRSLNLSNATAVIAYEALRQLNFAEFN